MKKTLLLSSMTVASLLSADPLATYIGAKAKSMGGAFTAVANNNSAMYFNPAGLTNFEGLENGMFTFEGGTGAKLDESALTFEDAHTTTGSWFFGLSSISPKGGFGFAMYTLYDLTFNQPNSTDTITEEVTVMSLSTAFSLVDQMYPYGGKLSIGVTGAYASSLSSESDYENNILSVNGYFYAVGVKARLLDHRAFKIDLGANYRSHATLDDTDYGATGYVGVGVPEEISYGIAAAYGTDFGLFTLSGDYKQTGYEDAISESNFSVTTVPAADITTANLGLEFATNTYQLRAGAYQSKYDSASDKISGITAGLGYVFSSYQLEAAFDQRTYDLGSQTTTTDFVTISANVAF